MSRLSPASVEKTPAVPPNRRLCVFAKPPEPGKVKTRLLPALKESDAAWLYLAFLNDLTRELLLGPYQLHFAWASEAGEKLPQHEGVVSEMQAAGNLGDRLFAAFAAGLAAAPVMVILGSDHPELQQKVVVEAFERLEAEEQVVLGPTFDGGYYLIGLRPDSLRRSLFDGIDWSTEKVFSQTVERCQEAGLRLSLLPKAHDIDLPEDLDGLADRLRRAPKKRCSFTRVLFEEWGRL